MDDPAQIDERAHEALLVEQIAEAFEDLVSEHTKEPPAATCACCPNGHKPDDRNKKHWR